MSAARWTFVLGALWLAGCNGAPGAGGRPFELGVIPGAQDFLVFVMDSRGLFEKYDLAPRKVEILSPPNLHLMIAEGEVDVGFGGFTTMAIARSKGKDVIVVHGVFSPVNRVFVLEGSPVETLADLKGRKLGIFGGPASTTFTFLAVIARRWHGVDLTEEVELVTAPGPALARLLESGEVDAALMGTAESLRFRAQGTHRTLVDLGEAYREREGRVPAHVTVATTESFAASQPDLLKDFVLACREAMAHARLEPELWARYGEKIGLTSEEEVAVLREEMSSSLVESWDAEQIEVQRQFLSLTQESLGDRIFEAVPEGLIRDDFNPPSDR